MTILKRRNEKQKKSRNRGQPYVSDNHCIYIGCVGVNELFWVIMKEFVIIGLDTLKKKREAEDFLEGLGYQDDKSWNYYYRLKPWFHFIKVKENGYYQYHKNNFRTINQPIKNYTLTEAREVFKKD